MRPQIEALLEGKDTGIIIRTNAYGRETKLLRELCYWNSMSES